MYVMNVICVCCVCYACCVCDVRRKFMLWMCAMYVRRSCMYVRTHGCALCMYVCYVLLCMYNVSCYVCAYSIVWYVCM